MPLNIIRDDLPAQQRVTQLSTLNQQAIVRPNNPPPGIAGFLFDVNGDDWIELMSEITDHYVENNTALQDQIALQPEKITVHGIVAELTIGSEIPDNPTLTADPLPRNVPMMPVFTPGTLATRLTNLSASLVSAGLRAAIAGVPPSTVLKGTLVAGRTAVVSGLQNQVSSVADSAVRALATPGNINALNSPGTQLPVSAQNAVGILKTLLPANTNTILGAVKTITVPQSAKLLTSATSANSFKSLFAAYKAKQPTPPKNTRQSSAFLYFYNLWKSRQLFSVETPWGIWNDMAILSLRAEQPEDSASSSNFTIVFKKVRIAKDVTIQLGQLAGRNTAQATVGQPSQNGNAGQQTATTPELQSWLYQWKNGP